MMLDYVALVILILIIGLVVYCLIAVWGIPYEIAKARHHPHQDAIGAATWVRLFTLGALWPFLWIWAMMYRPAARGQIGCVRKTLELSSGFDGELTSRAAH